MSPCLKKIEPLILETRSALDKLRAEETDRSTPLRMRLGELESAFSEVAALAVCRA